MKRSLRLNKSIVAASLVAFLCASVSLQAAEPVIAATASKVPSVQNTVPSVTGDFLVVDGGRLWGGVTYVSLEEARWLFQGAILTEDAASGTVTLLYPGMKVSYRPNTQLATVNGQRVKLAAAPVRKSGGVTYVAVRELGSRLKGSLTYDAKTKNLRLYYTPVYVAGGAASTYAWANIKTGALYVSENGQLPYKAGETSFRAKDMVSLSAERVGTSSVVIQIGDVWGEPHLGTDIYKVLVHQGAVVREAYTSYYGFGSASSIEKANGYVLMIDQGKLLWVKPDGTIAQSLSIDQKLGLDENFTVEYADQDLLLVRPYKQRKLNLINLKTGARVELYKTLLTAKEQEILDSWPVQEADYPGDQLQLVERKGDTLVFKHRVLLGSEELKVTYSLSSEQ